MTNDLPKTTDEQWLYTLNRITSLAQTGLHYCKDAYDIERYHEIIGCAESLLQLQNISTENFSQELLSNIGYVTPKLDIRAVVFQDNKLLLVKETQDGLWSLPGGWADVGYSASENAVKEVAEETGLQVEVKQLLSLLDRRKHPHPPMYVHVYKVFFLCEIIGGELRGSIETSEAKFFAENEIPPLSIDRVTYEQIADIFAQAKNNWQDFEVKFD